MKTKKVFVEIEVKKIIIIMVIISMLTIALLSETKNNYNKEIELKELAKQRDELKVKNENIKNSLDKLKQESIIKVN